MQKNKKLTINVIGNKGGVGKSKAAKTLVEGIRLHMPAATKLVCVDLDANSPSLGPVYGLRNETGKYDKRRNQMDPFSGVLSMDGRAAARDIPGALNLGADVLLFDFPGGQTDPTPILGSVDGYVDEFSEEGHDIVVVFVVGNSPESARGVIPAMKEWGPRVKFVIVKNLGLAAADKFDDFDGVSAKDSGYPAQTALKNGALIVEMPAIEKEAFDMLNQLKCPISELISHLEVERKKPEAPLNYRALFRGLKNYLADCEPMFEAIGILEAAEEPAQ